MEKKEAYRHILPHFQQPGQAYFVTWSLKDSIPAKALKHYTRNLEILRSQIESAAENNSDRSIIEQIKLEYDLVRKKYLKAYNEMLDASNYPFVDLSQPVNTGIIKNALRFWEGNKLINLAYTIMPNHVHWAFELLQRSQEGDPVYLQDILQSVKRFSSQKINKTLNRTGALWQKESFDTTIRDEKHLHYVINYTINNPVKAGFVQNWQNWPGTWIRFCDL